MLATLHLPPDWYPSEMFHIRRPNFWINCVSAAQQRTCPPGARLLGHIDNGVDVNRLAARYGKRNFALALGRICPEKGLHLALDAVKTAGFPLLLAGEVYRYESHEEYFRAEIVPKIAAFTTTHAGPAEVRLQLEVTSAAAADLRGVEVESCMPAPAQIARELLQPTALRA